MANLMLQNMSKIYKQGEKAVKDFNLNIKDKEFIVLVGPSGCGKSTILRMIAGLEDISDGDLYIDGTKMNHVSSKDRDIAMVFQNYALYPHMTVYQNMAFGLKMRRLTKHEIAERVKKATNIIGLQSFLNRKPAELSGGQKQRVALGRAIVRDAKVFLMDEPLSNLDAKLRVQMRAEINKLHEKLQTTTIYVTHDQTEAMTMASRIVVLNKGEIQQIGTPKDVYEKPENMFVASFLGSPAMNLIPATATAEGLRIEGFKDKVSLNTVELPSSGQVIVGLRPEDISINEAAPQFYATIESIERLGSESIINASMAGQSIAIKTVPDYNNKVGSRLPLSAHFRKFHLFDSETEKTIL
ncbi:ABC transporter ATP-binding protein [Cytobacillus horneckiae]|uniref:ABC transporter ATP-binding protein n=1 Tax=Cytobacillus horneckiae TaxID=549687 RepID=UPI003D9A7ABC